MPGSRGKNWRGGDLAEGLGLEFLRPFAFIAPVPRTEDIGIDAVATLFRRETHELIAQDSFLVQAKGKRSRVGMWVFPTRTFCLTAESDGLT
jgi:hypothetical protein